MLVCALTLALGGCNKTSDTTPSSQSNTAMTVPTGPQASFENKDDKNRKELERFKHVVVVIEENHAFNEVIGNPNMPYVNGLAQAGALMTDSHGVTHPSEPNYFALFSGSDQGVAADPCNWTVSGPNLASELMAKNKSFAIYSEDLPAQGDTSCTFTPAALLASSGDPAAGYRVKHNPYEFWQVEGLLPPEGNKTFAQFPKGDFDDLPTVSFVVPDQWHDEHDGTDVLCDQWLQQNMSVYNVWAKTHNSIMIVTWDENDFIAASNQVATIITGAEVIPGQYNQTINHYNVLRTLEDMYRLVPTNNAATADPIHGVFR